MVNRKMDRISIDRISSCQNFSCNIMSLDAATFLVIQDEEVVAFFTLNDNYSFNAIEGLTTFYKPQPII